MEIDRKKLNEQALQFHREKKGKIEITAKVPIENMRDLSLAYTPGVAAVSKAIAADPELAYETTIKANAVAVVTDGSAVLGLGNIGPAAALPVMEGKAALFKKFAGIDAFPICLDTQDAEEIITAVKRLAPVFGGINLEDIAAPKCFEIERRLKADLEIPVMHDDQHGTAVVVLAALINSLKIKNMRPADAGIIISGAGAAGIAVAELLMKYGFEHIIVCDSKGVLGRHRDDLSEKKAKIAQQTNRKGVRGTLGDAVRGSDIFIGVSKAGILDADMVRTMNPEPVVIAMANPVPEIMPEDAFEAGAKIVATGRSDYPNQVNNVLAFPGIFRGALDNRVRNITSDMLIQAARALAGAVESPEIEKILPDVFDKNVVNAVSGAIKE